MFWRQSVIEHTALHEGRGRFTQVGTDGGQVVMHIASHEFKLVVSTSQRYRGAHMQMYTIIFIQGDHSCIQPLV
ncbi:hypothetical protein DBR44_13205 [Aquitalea sp. FJL05]|nr:hypothetical protein DBR44_13205 [Aquitalea sp. FJL05]